MTGAHLQPCPACARHVRVSEEACPFCGERFGDALRGSPRPSPPAARLTRAALFAFGAGTVALAPACSSSSSAAPVLVQPAYGGALIDAFSGDDDAQGQAIPDATLAAVDAEDRHVDASAEASVDMNGDARVVAAYGGPPPQDAAPDHIAILPPYGIPPH